MFNNSQSSIVKNSVNTDSRISHWKQSEAVQQLPLNEEQSPHLSLESLEIQSPLEAEIGSDIKPNWDLLVGDSIQHSRDVKPKKGGNAFIMDNQGLEFSFVESSKKDESNQKINIDQVKVTRMNGEQQMNIVTPAFK